jgi:hypothetical protein
MSKPKKIPLSVEAIGKIPCPWCDEQRPAYDAEVSFYAVVLFVSPK